MAWGKRYIDELFAITLPAILAPNNLPALAEYFACELVIVTEEAEFARLRRHAIYGQLANHCRVEFRPIDDLVSTPDAYGMALTYALFRGFEDLGSDMVEVHLIFFNADFILADGSLRSVARKLLAGERLVLAPSYCVVLESIAPLLLRRRTPETGILAVPPRDMARLAIRHRHNTIRGKTVNQRLFSVEWMDQFYWLVDHQTLIGHQLPIAVVAMRPERVLSEMRTYWDYGIISEACPETTPCVLADSDEFLMIELRAADTAREQLALGWPEPQQIADRLARFMTRDPIALARHTLVLHAGEISAAALEQATGELDRFVERVLAKLPPTPSSWINHPNWLYHYPRFHQRRAAYLARAAPGGAAEEAAAAVSAAGVSTTEPADRKGLAGLARELYVKYFGRPPRLRPNHPRWADAQPIMSVLQADPQARILVASSEGLRERLFAELSTLRGAGKLDLAALSLASEPAAASGPADGCAASNRRNSLPCGAASMQSVDRRQADGAEAWRGATVQDVGEAAPEIAADADICVLELNLRDFSSLNRIADHVRTFVRPGGKILAFHVAQPPGSPEALTSLLEDDALALDLPCRLRIVGSGLSVRAINTFRRGIARLGRRRPGPAILGLAEIAAASVIARCAGKRAMSPPQRAPSAVTSVTVAIDVPAATA